MSTDVVDILVLDNGVIDNDNDGLSDYWEIQNFGDFEQLPTQDYDQDGYTNLEEFTLGLDPTIAQPVDAPTNVNIVPGLDSATVEWPAVSRATTYNIYWSTTPGVTTLTGNKIANVTSPFVHQNLTPGQIYYYIVTAENVGAGESPASLESTVKVGWKQWSDELNILDLGPNRTADNRENKLIMNTLIGGRGNTLVSVWQRHDHCVVVKILTSGKIYIQFTQVLLIVLDHGLHQSISKQKIPVCLTFTMA